MQHVEAQPVDRELKKGSTELLILSLVERRARHGYEICKLIESRSGRRAAVERGLSLSAALPPREAGLLEGRWVEKAGQRRRRFYRLTAAGRKTPRRTGAAPGASFVEAMNRITEAEHA